MQIKFYFPHYMPEVQVRAARNVFIVEVVHPKRYTHFTEYRGGGHLHPQGVHFDLFDNDGDWVNSFCIIDTEPLDDDPLRAIPTSRTDKETDIFVFLNRTASRSPLPLKVEHV